MKRFLPILILFIILSTPTLIFAESGVYIAGSVGLSVRPSTDITNNSTMAVIQQSFNPGYNFGVAVGYKFENNLRLETEIGFQKNLFDPGIGGRSLMSASNVLFNLWTDFDVEWPVKPYVGLGVGFSRVNLDAMVFGTLINQDDTVLAYHIGGGFIIPVWNGFSLTLSYRYFGTSEPEFMIATGPIEAEFESHQINGGFRLLFE